MKPEEIKKRIQEEIITQQFPELVNVEPTIETGRSESQLRTLRRSRGVLTEREMDTISLEHRFIFELEESQDQPFDKTVVVVTDEEGQTQYIMESK